MGFYTVWVIGNSPLEIVERYDEGNDIPGSFPGLTFDYIAEIEEPGPASHFATLHEDEFPFAIVSAAGQVVKRAYPGSDTDPTVIVGVEHLRKHLEENLDAMVTPMKWHA